MAFFGAICHVSLVPRDCFLFALFILLFGYAAVTASLMSRGRAQSKLQNTDKDSEVTTSHEEAVYAFDSGDVSTADAHSCDPSDNDCSVSVSDVYDTARRLASLLGWFAEYPRDSDDDVKDSLWRLDHVLAGSMDGRITTAAAD